MLGKFLRYHDPNLSLKYCNPQVPALLSGLVYPDSFLSVLIIQAEFLFSFYLLSVSIRALRFVLTPLSPTDCPQATSSAPLYR